MCYRSMLLACLMIAAMSQVSAQEDLFVPGQYGDTPSCEGVSCGNETYQRSLQQQICSEPCEPFWIHRTAVFGDYLFLSARGQDLDYATPVDGTTNTAVPVGPTAMVNPGYRSGYRVGGTIAVDDCSSLYFAWTSFDSNVTDQTVLPGGAPAPNAFLRSELVHPNTLDVAVDSLSAGATYGIGFQAADAAYQKTIFGDCKSRLNGSLGFRYGGLTQDLRARETILGDVLVSSDIDFKGYGPRFALDYEQCSNGGLLFYTRGGASVLAGRFDATYQQTSIFAGQQALAGVKEDRLVPQLDLELGTGYQSKGGRFRATVGYMYGIWGNVVTMPGFIDGVQADAVRGVNDTLTFDGLAVRAELRF